MDDLVTAINTLLALVPEQHRAWVEALMALLYALGLFLAAVRPLLARVPAGGARWWVDAVDIALHVAAGNSKPTASRPAPLPKAKP